ncbi:MAG: PTS sugar transporter subunit IIA [Ignavibacteria bacterium]|nr:PTS sugar transporter subunit IIA [Ignavibacteriota bacterium]
MKVSDILTDKIIEINLPATDKNDAINKMIELANNSGNITNLEAVRKCVFEREKLVSTGVGKGFAIPHGKSDEIKDIVAAFAVLKDPIDFDSIDGEEVRFIFLLVGKDSMLNLHIKLLSRISRLMNKDEFREKLLKSESKEAALKLFVEEEQSYLDI